MVSPRRRPSNCVRPPKFGKAVTDAFYPDAREKLAGPRPQKATAATAAAGPAANGSPAPSSDKAAEKAGKSPWPKLIAAETIEDEIKSQQQKLAATVTSAAAFKGGGYQQARLHLSVLAVMFALDAQYGQAMRWQREAAAMSAATARAGFNCKVGTDASFAETRRVSDDLQNLVRGESVELPAADPASQWSQVADRAPLMKRLEQAQQQGLAAWLANAREFARSSDKVSHEAQLVAVLAEVIAREGYEFADDDSYRAYAQRMGAKRRPCATPRPRTTMSKHGALPAKSARPVPPATKATAASALSTPTIRGPLLPCPAVRWLYGRSEPKIWLRPSPRSVVRVRGCHRRP